MKRRDFLKNIGLGAGALSLAGSTVVMSSFSFATQKVKNWAWLSAPKPDSMNWEKHLAQLKESNINALLLQAPAEVHEHVIPKASKLGIEIHAWITTTINGDKELQKEHPEYYMVNRNGVSCLEKPPYVGYYTWLCPSRPETLEYLKNRVKKLTQISGLAGVHLDYVRYPDVILPITLQPKYGIVQDKEYPEYDFCYCPVCRSKFQEKHGIDPMKIQNPAAHTHWLQYRYDTITHLVNQIAKVTAKAGKKLTAAVFPSPEIARNLVRQEWFKWNLDAVMPMMYHSFYDKGLDWIAEVTRQGKKALKEDTPLYSGLFIPEIEPAEVSKAAHYAFEGGADGIVLFTSKTMNNEHWKELTPFLNKKTKQ